jgi:hypothetical protein
LTHITVGVAQMPDWHVVLAYAAHSLVALHPGKQTSWLSPFSRHTPAMPAEFLPQFALVVHDSVHHRPLQLFETHCALDVHGSPMLWGRPQKVVAEPTSGWHVVPAYAAQLATVPHPGKQTFWLLASSRQTPAMPAEFLPQSELVVQDAVHHEPLQLFEAHCVLDVHGSPMLWGRPQKVVAEPTSGWHVVLA